MELDLRDRDKTRTRVRWTCEGCGEDQSTETSKASIDLEAVDQMCGCCGPETSFLFEGTCSGCLETTTIEVYYFSVEKVDPTVCSHPDIQTFGQRCYEEGVGRKIRCRVCNKMWLKLRNEDERRER